MPETAVILVNWRGAEDTGECLEAISQLNGPRPLTIVVENGSQDGSAAVLREAENCDVLIESPLNLGFGGGCNLGITYALATGGGRLHLAPEQRRAARARRAECAGGSHAR